MIKAFEFLLLLLLTAVILRKVTKFKSANLNLYSNLYSKMCLQIIKLDAPSDEEQFKTLVDSVKYAIHTEGYYWSSPNGAGGWTKVLQAYNPSALVSSGQNSNNYNRQRGGYNPRQGPYQGNRDRDYGYNRRGGHQGHGQWRPR